MKGNGWWDRKPEKRHLEVLFTTGDLMVSERRNFQRVYDVRERVLPDWDDTRDLPPRHAVLPALLDYTCRALGVVRADWVADYYRLPRAAPTAELEQLADAGDLIPVAIEDWKEPAYVHRSLEALLPAAGGRHAALDGHDAAVAIRSGGMGPPASVDAVRIRLHDRMLYARTSGVTAISACRCCIAGGWSGASTRRRIARSARSN